MTNTDIVNQAYSNFVAGDIPAVLALFDPAIEWNESTGMPFIKGDGLFKGPDAVLNNVFMNLPVFFDGFRIEVNEVFGKDDKVVMEGYYHGTNKATGNTFKANATHIWTVKNGKLARCFQAVDTATISK